MKICVFGCSGFLGKEFIKQIGNEHHLILPSRKFVNIVKEDNKIFLPFDIEKNVFEYKPDIIINFMGILKETRNNKYEDVHVDNVGRIVSSALKNNTKKIIHISAYGVFKGCNSRYFKTKERAEEIIKNSGIDYLIIRPSVILGEGQKLISDLRMISSFSPVIFAPQGKVAPIDINEVMKSILEAINGKRNGVLELFGKVISYSDLFKKILSDINIKRVVIEVPNFLFLPLIITQFFIKEPLMTYDLYKMIGCDYIYDKK